MDLNLFNIFKFFKKSESDERTKCENVDKVAIDYREHSLSGIHSFNLDLLYCGERIGEARGEFVAQGDYRLVKIQIEPENRGQGYSKRIINKLMEEAQVKQCSSFIFVGVGIKNGIAIKLYKNFGASPEPIKGCSDKFDYRIPLQSHT